MKVAIIPIPRIELGDFIIEIIRYGKFYGVELRSIPLTEFSRTAKDYLFTLTSSEDVFTLTFFVECKCGDGSRFWQFSAKVDLPKEECSFCKNYTEFCKDDTEARDFEFYVKDEVEVNDLLGVIVSLGSFEEFRGEPDERRNEFAEVYESVYGSPRSLIPIFRKHEFTEYLLKHATLKNPDIVRIGLRLLGALDLEKYIRDNNSNDN